MIENNQKNQNKFDWRPALFVWVEISSWIAVPIVLALILGKWIDARLGSEPWGLICLACFGFLISSYGIVKAVKNYANKIKDNN